MPTVYSPQFGRDAPEPIEGIGGNSGCFVTLAYILHPHHANEAIPDFDLRETLAVAVPRQGLTKNRAPIAAHVWRHDYECPSVVCGAIVRRDPSAIARED